MVIATTACVAVVVTGGTAAVAASAVGVTSGLGGAATGTGAAVGAATAAGTAGGAITGAAAGSSAAAAGIGAAAGGTAAAGVSGSGVGIGGLIAGSSLGGPLGLLALGAEPNHKSGDITYDCWKPVLHNTSPEPSNGMLIRDVVTHPNIANVTVTSSQCVEMPDIVLENIWNEKFAIQYVLIHATGKLACHALRI